MKREGRRKRKRMKKRGEELDVREKEVKTGKKKNIDKEERRRKGIISDAKG